MGAFPQVVKALEDTARAVVSTMRHACPWPLRALGLPTGVHATIDDWARENADANHGESLTLVRAEARSETVQVSARHLPAQEHPAFTDQIVYVDLRTFVARLSDARVTGRNGFVLDSTGNVLGDVPKVYRSHYTPKDHPLLRVVRPPTVEELPGTSAALAIFSTGNYYHWMFEGLPRLELLRQTGCELAGIDWFIVNTMDNQFVQPSLAALGIPASKLRSTHDGRAFRCENLLVPSMPCQTNPSRWVCEFLRASFLPKAPPVRKERLFVSRAPGARRRILNEEEVEVSLARRGFRKVYLETCTLAEQIELFTNAEAVVAAHGASMANLVFCPPNTKVIEIFNPEYVNPCYWGVAQQVGLNYAYLLSEGAFTGVAQNIARCGDDLQVNVVQLEQLLELCES